MPSPHYDRSKRIRKIFREVVAMNYTHGKWETIGPSPSPINVRVIRKKERWNALLQSVPTRLGGKAAVKPLIPIPKRVDDYFVVDGRDATRLPYRCDLFGSAGGKLASFRYDESKIAITFLRTRGLKKLFGLEGEDGSE